MAKERHQFDAMARLYEQSHHLDFWTMPRHLDRPMDVMVPPAHADAFTSQLRDLGIGYRIKISNVQK